MTCLVSTNQARKEYNPVLLGFAPRINLGEKREIGTFSRGRFSALGLIQTLFVVK